MGTLLRLPLAVFEHTEVAGHQNLARDHLAYCDLAADRQQRANIIVRKHHAHTVSRGNRRNSTLADSLRPALKFALGGLAWVNYSASTIRQGMKANTDAKVLEAKLALNWAGLHKVLAVGPCSSADTPDGSPLLGSLFRPARFLCSSSRSDKTLQTLRHPPRQQWHAQIFTGGTDPVCAQSVSQEITAVPCHSRRRFGSP